MPIMLGYNSYLGFRELSVTTSMNTVPAEFIFCDSMAFTKNIESEIINEMGVGTRTSRRRVTKNISANGTFSKKVDPNNGIALYQYLLAGTVTSASNSSLTFTHTFGQDDEVPSSTRLQFEYAQGGNSATNIRFFNGVVESYSLNAAIGNAAQETWNLRFSDHTTAANTLATIAITQTPPIMGNQISVRIGTSLTAVSEVAMKDFTLNISNEIMENRELSTNTVSDFMHGIQNVSGNMNITFEDLTQYNQFIQQTASAIQVQLSSSDTTSATTHYIRWNLPRVFYTGATPQVQSTGEIVQPISFEAIFDSGVSYQVQAVVLNADATATK